MSGGRLFGMFALEPEPEPENPALDPKDPALKPEIPALALAFAVLVCCLQITIGMVMAGTSTTVATTHTMAASNPGSMVWFTLDFVSCVWGFLGLGYAEPLKAASSSTATVNVFCTYEDTAPNT